MGWERSQPDVRVIRLQAVSSDQLASIEVPVTSWLPERCDLELVGVKNCVELRSQRRGSRVRGWVTPV